eukprot:1195244-Prorocentrum_minimum.AAC.12
MAARQSTSGAWRRQPEVICFGHLVLVVIPPLRGFVFREAQLGDAAAGAGLMRLRLLGGNVRASRPPRPPGPPPGGFPRQRAAPLGQQASGRARKGPYALVYSSARSDNGSRPNSDTTVTLGCPARQNRDTIVTLHSRVASGLRLASKLYQRTVGIATRPLYRRPRIIWGRIEFSSGGAA